MKGLFLDDERSPQDATWMKYPENIEWVVVRTFSEFAKAIQSTPFAVLSFDHDIQDFSKGSELTGYDCLKFYCNFLDLQSLPLPQLVVVHSMNPIGKVNIMSYWKNFLEVKVS